MKDIKFLLLISKKIERRLTYLSNMSGRSKSFIIRRLINCFWEDYFKDVERWHDRRTELITRSEYEPVTDKEKEELKQIEAKIKQYWRDHFPEYEGYED